MFKKTAVSLALAIAASVSAHATPLGLNSTIPAAAGTLGGLTFVAQTGLRTLFAPATPTSAGFTVNYGEAVAFDTNNPLGGLDFIYSFDNVGAVGIVESVSMANYDSFLTDAIYVSKGLPNEIAPTTVSRATTGLGSVVHFNFVVPNDVVSGETTDYLVIRTNATTVRPGTFSFLDGTSADDLNVYGPAAATTPEPSSLVLFGTGLLGAAGIARRKFASKFGV